MLFVCTLSSAMSALLCAIGMRTGCMPCSQGLMVLQPHIALASTHQHVLLPLGAVLG